MNYIPHLRVAQFSIRCSSLRQDIITAGQEYVKLGTKRFCLKDAGEKLVEIARQGKE